ALGQPVAEVDGQLVVSLQGELAGYYGRETLVLTFKPHDREGELVAYGSRAFEAMQEYLATRGRFAACALPPAEAEAPPVTLVNGQASALAAEAWPRRYYMINFHLAFLSDERKEQLFSLCLDEDGRPAPEAAAWLEAAGGGEPTDGVSELPEAVVAAAEAAALAEAEREALPIEEAVLGRLKKTAGRLVTYFQEQIDEAPYKRRRGQSEDEALEAMLEERRFLKRELDRKLEEEVVRHQLRVQVRRISQAVILVPGVQRRWALEAGESRRHVSYWENRHTGECEQAGCERCGVTGHEVGLCHDGHLTCPACLGSCGPCGHDHCRSELATCHQCGEGACERCREACATGHLVCREHLGSCGCCGQAYCGGCLERCPECPPDSRLARAHGAVCGACDGIVCRAHAASCALCPATLCGSHAVGCPGCGDRVCVSHMRACSSCELPYCDRCREDGSACRACMAVGHGPLAPESWLAPLAGVQEASRYGRWVVIENERYRYMLGRGLLGDLLVVVEEGRVVKVKEIGLWQKLFGPC
ncbi:MAG: hypothetical protein ACLGIN_13320, partial [Candidatus Sericytochromatia bacterium]